MTSDAPQPGGDAQALLGNLPQLHHWGGSPQVGGLNRPIGERIITEVARYDRPRIVETGAGATTLLFCCLDPAALTSIALKAELHENILQEAAARQIGVDCLRFICARSEIALPRIASEGDRYEVGLMDGSHNWPSVFVDFCYINMMMPAGGTLFVDDLHLYSVAQLYLLLRQQDQFEQVALDGKFATFRKLVDKPFLPEWFWEPYIADSSPVPLPDTTYPASGARP